MSFRFQNKRCLLTYRTHVDKQAMIAFINGKSETEMCRVAHENGDTEAGYEHSHVLVKFKRIFQSTNERIFDFNDIHPHIATLRTNTHWNNAVEYIAKEDPENADLKRIMTPVEGIWGHETMAEALKACKSLKDVIATKAAFAAKPDEGETMAPPATWRPWQQQLLDILHGPVNSREIIWIVDPIGGGGKSVLTRYLSDHEDAICMTQAPGQRDTAQLLTRFMPLSRRTIVFDFARQTEDKQFYEPMEHIKNGLISSTKYEGQTLKWIPGHLVVMANFAPEKGKWSWDRYRVMQITTEQTMQPTNYSGP